MVLFILGLSTEPGCLSGVQKPITVKQLRAINDLGEEVTQLERLRSFPRCSGSCRGAHPVRSCKEISSHPSFWESKFHSTLWKLGLIISKYHLKISDQHCGVIKYTQLEYWAYNLWEWFGIYRLIILFYSLRHNLHYVSVNNEHQTLTKLPHFFLCFLDIGKCITNSNLFWPRNCSVTYFCRPVCATQQVIQRGIIFSYFFPKLLLLSPQVKINSN